jgi:hypothetical protein
MLTTNPSENQLTRVHAFFGLIRCLDGYQGFPKSANLKNFNLCASKSEKANRLPQINPQRRRSEKSDPDPNKLSQALAMSGLFSSIAI